MLYEVITDPQVEEGLAEAGRGRAEAQVAHAGEVEAGADGRAVDGGDERDLGPRQGQRQALDAAPVLVLDRQRGSGEDPLPVSYNFV